MSSLDTLDGKGWERMRRLNFLDDEPWDEVSDDARVRWFGHPFEADKLGASLWEFPPGSPGGPLHMHYGVEEMFVVLSGTLTVRTPEGTEELVPGDVVYFPEGPEGLHDFSNPSAEPVRMLAVSTSGSPMSSLTRSGELHGWRRAIPSAPSQSPVTKESSRASICPAASEARRSADASDISKCWPTRGLSPRLRSSGHE
jgi:uncharacterized cupin superfamily protein